MKHRLVPGSTAGCALHSLRRGLLLLPKPTFARHAVCAAVAGSCGGSSQRRPYSAKPPFTTLSPRQPSLHPHSSTLELPLPMGEQLRHMMRLLPHSVLVCTSFSPTSQNQQPRAMTVSSFTSLSLSPALVTFHVATPSRTLDAIKTSGVLNFHVLSGDELGAGVAAHFTSGNNESVFSGEGLRGAGLRVRTEGGYAGGSQGKDDQERVEEKEEAKEGQLAPVLEGQGVMYVLRCKLFKEAQDGVVMVRDHAIVVAEVVEIIETSGRTEEGHESFGLVYADRHYRGLGETFVRSEGGGEDVLRRFEETGADSD
ncbi:flavin reductase like domain-containing protein [Coniochaeta sp. 2T2.1]|nr:flavin reductase like domain-containing protein [Coniochaeta sp. 2T2.1]